MSLWDSSGGGGNADRRERVDLEVHFQDRLFISHHIVRGRRGKDQR